MIPFEQFPPKTFFMETRIILLQFFSSSYDLYIEVLKISKCIELDSMVRIMCQSGSTCLPVDCYFSELAL